MAVGAVQAFAASGPANTVTVAASTTPAAATLPGNGETVLVTNGAAALAFVRVDGSTATATASDIPVPANGQILLQVSPYSSRVAAVLASGTGSVYFTRGTGSAR